MLIKKINENHGYLPVVFSVTLKEGFGYALRGQILFFLITFNVSKVSWSKFCLYFFQIVLRSKLSPYSQQSKTI